jgi:hypothetical protein
MNCPMAVLTEETKTSDASKLPSAAFIPFSHPSGLILMKSKIAPQKNKKNICYSQTLMDIILLDQVILLMVINGKLYEH